MKGNPYIMRENAASLARWRHKGEKISHHEKHIKYSLESFFCQGHIVAFWRQPPQGAP